MRSVWSIKLFLGGCNVTVTKRSRTISLIHQTFGWVQYYCYFEGPVQKVWSINILQRGAMPLLLGRSCTKSLIHQTFSGAQDAPLMPLLLRRSRRKVWSIKLFLRGCHVTVAGKPRTFSLTDQTFSKSSVTLLLGRSRSGIKMSRTKSLTHQTSGWVQYYCYLEGPVQ